MAIMKPLRSLTTFTHTEAARMLQPLMPGRNASLWLIQDRERDPVLPYVLFNNEVRYLRSDVRLLMVRLTRSTADIRRLPAILGHERRRGGDRRSGMDRRARGQTELPPDWERRENPHGERRQAAAQAERRGGPSRWQRQHRGRTALSR